MPFALFCHPRLALVRQKISYVIVLCYVLFQHPLQEVLIVLNQNSKGFCDLVQQWQAMQIPPPWLHRRSNAQNFLAQINYQRKYIPQNFFTTRLSAQFLHPPVVRRFSSPPCVHLFADQGFPFGFHGRCVWAQGREEAMGRRDLHVGGQFGFGG